MEYKDTDIKVFGRLANVTVDGILADSQQIYDSTSKTFQSDLNDSFATQIQDLQNKIESQPSDPTTIQNMLELHLFVTDNDGNFTYQMDGNSENSLYNLIRKYQEEYPLMNEFPLITNVIFQQNGSSDQNTANKIFDKMWYVDYTNRLECTIQRIQLQHTNDDDSTLSMFTIKVSWNIQNDSKSNSTVTARENFIRIQNSGDGNKFLNDKGVYSSVPQTELPIDIITTGDGTKFLSDDGTYKEIKTVDNPLYEEIDMKVYKLTAQNNKALDDTNKQILLSYKQDCKNGDPSLLFVKQDSHDFYQLYTISNPYSLKYVDQYDADDELNVVCVISSCTHVSGDIQLNDDGQNCTDVCFRQIQFEINESGQITPRLIRNSSDGSIVSKISTGGHIFNIAANTLSMIDIVGNEGSYTANVSTSILNTMYERVRSTMPTIDPSIYYIGGSGIPASYNIPMTMLPLSSTDSTNKIVKDFEMASIYNVDGVCVQCHFTNPKKIEGRSYYTFDVDIKTYEATEQN